MLSSLIDRHTHSTAMKGQIMITQEQLKELLDYNPDTGIFTWKVDRSIAIKKGKVAGYKRPDGYIVTSINKKLYYLHRLAWLYVHGNFPNNVIDHINKDKSDNKLCNLRDVTTSFNNINCNLRSNNSSGYTGISFVKNINKWRVRIKINKKTKCLGYFLDINEALKKYNDFKSSILMPN